MKYLRQIYYEMKHQKMMTWVSIAGTALAIFLVMVFYLVDSLDTVEVAPESNRARILIGQNLEVAQEDGTASASGSLNHQRAYQLYHNLEGVERESFIFQQLDEKDISFKGGESQTIFVRGVDNEFWNIYDFKFIDGKPFDKADIESSLKKIIITRSLARRLFNEEKVSGREVLLGMLPFTISGVVEDANPILKITSANAFVPYMPEINDGRGGRWGDWLGNTQVVLLVKPDFDFANIQKQVMSRYDRLQSEARKDEKVITYHGQPYDIEILSKDIFSNVTPTKGDSYRWLIYAFLILIPAINLSSMTRSRLRHRVSEIGIYRAFGASKISILWQTMIENFLITIFGGIIGLLLCMLFMVSFSHLFFTFGSDLDVYARPSLNMIFTWKTFLIALLFSCILNLVSAFIPSWKASRLNPAEAIRKVK
ncbi:MAG: ABC transporter permease [Muribaculaceae bacterium]|nr:ABC transporter permease [Muribaculaceae bacterium]